MQTDIVDAFLDMSKLKKLNFNIEMKQKYSFVVLFCP